MPFYPYHDTANVYFADDYIRRFASTTIAHSALQKQRRRQISLMPSPSL
ncbi:MAG: hypothetical protein J6R27_05890 [Muribaculaceae bacterium]|nr:hypothetical protein [Muribaculaceae bacterium]